MLIICSLRTHWLARLRSAVAVSTLIGLSWILGFFALGEASFAINVIFSLCNSLQVRTPAYIVSHNWRSKAESLRLQIDLKCYVARSRVKSFKLRIKNQDAWNIF